MGTRTDNAIYLEQEMYSEVMLYFECCYAPYEVNFVPVLLS